MSSAQVKRVGKPKKKYGGFVEIPLDESGFHPGSDRTASRPHFYDDDDRPRTLLPFKQNLVNYALPPLSLSKRLCHLLSLDRPFTSLQPLLCRL